MLQGCMCYEMNGTLCVYRSNSRMCFDMSPRIGGGMYYKQDEESNPLPRVQMYPLDVTDSMVISFLTLQHYHEIVSCSQRSDTSSIGVHPAVSIPELGALITGIPRSGELLEDPIQVAAVSNRTAKLSGWHGNMRSGQSMLMPNGWTRYQMSEVMTIGSAINSAVDYPCAYPWVTQANHIFSRLGNSKKSGKDFALLREVMYGLDLEGGTRASRRPQNAYIFLCPEKELRRQDGTGFRYPPCPAYWSFDPTGVEKLSEEKARNLGFPTINLRMHIWAYTWSKGVYEGIRKFQQGKGFDSDSQDVAVQLGVPLYELSVQRDFFAHADDRTESSEDTEDSADDDNLGPPGMVIYATDNGSFSLQSGSGTRPSTFQMDIVINDPDPSMFAHVDDLGSNDGSESEVELPAPTPDISDNDEQLETLSPEHNEIEQSDNGNNAVQPVLGNSEAGINLVNFEKPVDMSKPSKSRLDLKISMLNRKMWFFAALGLALGLITFQNYIVNFYKVPATVGGPDKTGLARAIERAQTLETWLDDESLVTFIELLARDSGTVETYNALHRGSVRVEWVRRKLGRE
ncbi:hypothetical protein C8J57DRAFT_190936 [Mycena rebaudengoi]|nr:hypothetical protein C8J57DRAFT_190936 [Mycena rebaudengoi]